MRPLPKCQRFIIVDLSGKNVEASFRQQAWATEIWARQMGPQWPLSWIHIGSLSNSPRNGHGPELTSGLIYNQAHYPRLPKKGKSHCFHTSSLHPITIAPHHLHVAESRSFAAVPLPLTAYFSISFYILWSTLGNLFYCLCHRPHPIWTTHTYY